MHNELRCFTKYVIMIYLVYASFFKVTQVYDEVGDPLLSFLKLLRPQLCYTVTKSFYDFMEKWSPLKFLLICMAHEIAFNLNDSFHKGSLFTFYLICIAHQEYYRVWDIDIFSEIPNPEAKLIFHLQNHCQTTSGDCYICLQPHQNLIKLPCHKSHVFHPHCLKKWWTHKLKTACPVCKKAITL